MDYYTLNICGFVRKLPIVKIGPRFSVASFSLLGDIELVDILAQELIGRIKYLDFDYLVGVETKILPLVYQMSRLLGSKNYVLVRQSVLGYMTEPVRSGGKQSLVINGPDGKLLEGKKVVLIDDVVGSGKTMDEVITLMDKVGAGVTALASVFKQGEKEIDLGKPFFYLGMLPIFEHEQKDRDGL